MLRWRLILSADFERCIFPIFRLIVYILFSPSTLLGVFELRLMNSFPLLRSYCVFHFLQFFIFFGLPNTVSLTSVAGSESIFRPLSKTHISKRVFMNEISRSDLLDIQLTLPCVCGVDSFLPELEHL